MFSTRNGVMRVCRGMTLPELLVVLAIIAVLSLLSFPVYESYLNRSNIVPALTELGLVQGRVDNYMVHNGRCIVSVANQTSYPESRFFSGYVLTRDPINTDQCLIKAKFKSTAPSADFQNKIVWLRRVRSGLWNCQVSITAPLTQTECVYQAGLDMNP